MEADDCGEWPGEHSGIGQVARTAPGKHWRLQHYLLSRYPLVRTYGLVLLALVWPAFAVAEPSESPTGDNVVKMDTVEVKSDPFRSMGAHGMIYASLFGGVQMKATAVNPGSPAAKAGLRAGDEMIELGGKKIGLHALFLFKAMMKDAVAHGTSFSCVVRAGPGAELRSIVIKAMAEPKHRWLPVTNAPRSPQPTRDPMPLPHDGAIAGETWHDCGRATPQAALESLFWRLARGDTDGVAGMIEVSGDAQSALSAIYTSLPDSGRRYYGGPERMLAAFVGHEDLPRWIHVRSSSSDGTDEATLDVELQFWDDFEHRQLRKEFRFHREADGWKWIPSKDSVGQYAGYYHEVRFEIAPPDEVPVLAWFFHSS